MYQKLKLYKSQKRPLDSGPYVLQPAALRKAIWALYSLPGSIWNVQEVDEATTAEQPAGASLSR